jgi:hypothetical protein
LAAQAAHLFKSIGKDRQFRTLFPLISVCSHQNGFEPALEKRSDPPMLAIEPHAVRNVESLNGFDDEMSYECS